MWIIFQQDNLQLNFCLGGHQKCSKKYETNDYQEEFMMASMSFGGENEKFYDNMKVMDPSQSRKACNLNLGLSLFRPAIHKTDHYYLFSN